MAPCAERPCDLEPDRQHALRLHADLKVGGLAGDREVARGSRSRPARRSRGSPPPRTPRRRRSRAGGAPPSASRRSCSDEQHHRQRALHVVGAAADQPVAIDPRARTDRGPGDDVDMAVQHEGRRVGRPDLGDRHRQPARLRSGDAWMSRDSSQPPTNSAARRSPSALGGVEGDQLARSAQARPSSLQMLEVRLAESAAFGDPRNASARSLSFSRLRSAPVPSSASLRRCVGVVDPACAARSCRGSPAVSPRPPAQWPCWRTPQASPRPGPSAGSPPPGMCRRSSVGRAAPARARGWRACRSRPRRCGSRAAPPRPRRPRPRG